MAQEALIEAVFTGQPKLISDERGTWTSSIFRKRTEEPVPVLSSGLAGDKVTQPYHGGPGAAICVHMADHYVFWNMRLAINLEAGSFGENITLVGITEDRINVGDHVRFGTALVQVSGPRVPCANLARRIGRSDWVRQTIRENRTGFYLRVLEPGVVQSGNPWLLEKRINTIGSIPSINQCMYLNFDPDFARLMIDMPGLETWWKEQAQQKLGARDKHWTATMKDKVDSKQS